ncbi:DUF4350 domain-containing protein [Dethiobacter alkaliphilus]|uniref:DUF4350 domain-containing protein n=1 Tax=Dethiobacter alkaliphilus AHT 1 TaxID=555088 RepID=C0GFK6_DETAL|nr:DUF4350 domain-containing protein [Dethiobacter alkaliphilus]EEG77966.1 hypothetical protein DealDRAFT_1265 [Dethiobacter alkaliphilus AHT 1]
MTKKKIIVLFVVALLVISLLIFRTAGPYQPYSSYSPMADGTKAIYLLLEEVGISSAQLLDAVPSDPGLMILIEPGDTLLVNHWHDLAEWVSQGNTIFIAAQHASPLYEQLELDTELVFHEPETHRISTEQDIKHHLLQDVETLTLNWGTRLVQHDKMGFAYGDQRGIFLAEKTLGEGQIIILTQSYLLTNRFISQADNLILFLNVVRNYGQEGVWFNELAHGFSWTDEPTTAFIWPLRFAAAQLALGIALLFFFWGKRFGRPIPLTADHLPEAGEYITSLANIYRQGKAQKLALESFHQAFLDNLAKYLGAGANIPAHKLVQIFSKRPWVNVAELEELLTQCETLKAKTDITEQELFTLARNIDMWQENNLLRRPERRNMNGRQSD